MSFLVLIGVAGVSSFFAPKIYCDYIESEEREKFLPPEGGSGSNIQGNKGE